MLQIPLNIYKIHSISFFFQVCWCPLCCMYTILCFKDIVFQVFYCPYLFHMDMIVHWIKSHKYFSTINIFRSCKWQCLTYLLKVDLTMIIFTVMSLLVVLALKFALDYENEKFRHLIFSMNWIKVRLSSLGIWEEILKHKLHQFL